MKIYANDTGIYSLDSILKVEKFLWGNELKSEGLCLTYKDTPPIKILFSTDEKCEEAFKEITRILEGD